jgi:hypothetical protein
MRCGWIAANITNLPWGRAARQSIHCSELAAGRMYSPASSLFICHPQTFEMGRAGHPLRRSRQSRRSYKPQRYNRQSSYSPSVESAPATRAHDFVVPMLIRAQGVRLDRMDPPVCADLLQRWPVCRSVFGTTMRAKRALSSRCVFFSVYRRSAVCFGAQ